MKNTILGVGKNITPLLRTMNVSITKLMCCLAIAALRTISDTHAQATVKETTQTLKTYGFSDPSPLPLIGRVYPYTKFEGYTDKGTMKGWKFVELENPYIKVSVTPEIGGKIWGAYDKATNFPFVYFNHVVKFRNVAMRGPWSSGGIELNFGDIGHAPTVATPVDYATRTNSDGSVSCFVGAWDWSARTRWTVEINLPKDKALFTTKSRWFNASPLETSYYHWINAGFKAAGNLEFAFQGSHTLGHDGDIRPWPKDSLGRNLNFYEQNNFGSYKSYHVLGKPSDFYGGYWHDDQAGFVHYAPFSDKLGQKIWIWGLSRQGMIWENLLTDNDGQYVELQSGRLFNQAGGGSTNSPFKHIFREANVRHAIELLKSGKSKDALTYLDQAETWPENLGSGQPYDPDNRLTAALKAYARDKKVGDLKKIKQGLPEKEQKMLEAMLE